MVNSESSGDLFELTNSSDGYIVIGESKTTSISKCDDCFSDTSSSHVDKAVQVSMQCESCLKVSNTLSSYSVVSYEDKNIEEENSSVSGVSSDSDSPQSLDLHLSSETESEQQESTSEKFINENLDEDPLNESLTPDFTAEVHKRTTPDYSRVEISPDMFESSQEVLSQYQCSSSLIPHRNSSSVSVLTMDGSPDSTLSQADNRETEEEWNSQDLSYVSQSLKVRRKQIKRMISAVIRKRQMEDETLEAFKKRLKRL